MTQDSRALAPGEVARLLESAAAAIRAEFAALEATPHTRMITPAVLEIIVTR